MLHACTIPPKVAIDASTMLLLVCCVSLGDVVEDPVVSLLLLQIMSQARL